MLNMAQEGVHHLEENNNDNVQATWAHRPFHTTDACIQHTRAPPTARLEKHILK